MNSSDFARLCSRFALNASVIHVEAYGSGHINDTYRLEMEERGGRTRYILQRINDRIFLKPIELMNNMEKVLRHQHAVLRSTGVPDASRRALTLIPAHSGRPFVQDDEGGTWRLVRYIERTHSFDLLENTEQAVQAARSFALFQSQLATLPEGPLTETIPRFHDTPFRLNTLKESIDRNAMDRVGSAGPEIEFALAHERETSCILEGLSSGRIPTRIAHNDTKLNNVLFDDCTGEGICVIDLDTVMPGSVLYDFGDLVRTAANTAHEDERDLKTVSLNLSRFEALARGYLSEAKSFLTQDEIDLLAFSGKLISLETGIRFLTDYLNGDLYFKTERPRQNLDRCRVQFKLVESIEAQMTSMKQIVAKTKMDSSGRR